MNDNSTILQKIKDNAFYIALGVGILAIIALIALYTMRRDGQIYEINDIDLSQPSDYSAVKPDSKKDVDNIPDSSAADKMKKRARISDKAVEGDNPSDVNATDNNATGGNSSGTSMSQVSQSNVSDTTSAPENVPEGSTDGKVENAPGDTAGNPPDIAQNDASDDGEKLPVTADVGELDFGSDKTLSWPVQGEIILPFSMETTVYYKTLDQYRTNPGILIAAGSGSTVKNAYLGKVVKVTSDNTYGNLVTIYLGNDYSVVYGQLDTIYVKEGDFVKAGESVGTIGKPTDSFEEEGSHLFFKLLNGDTPVDPVKMME